VQEDGGPTNVHSGSDLEKRLKRSKFSSFWEVGDHGSEQFFDLVVVDTS
jgi:hypothetical protein